MSSLLKMFDWKFLALGNGCDGTQLNIWSCCSSFSQCGENEGDCDANSDCLGNLKCGTNNCIGANFPFQADCCY